MKTAWTVFADWKHSHSAVKDAIKSLKDAVGEFSQNEFLIADLLRRHGPVVHDGRVYSVRGNEIISQPCTDSIQLKVEEE